MRAILLALGFFLAGATVAQSRQPPQPGSATSVEATIARGTTQDPLVVDVVPSSDATERAENEERDRGRDIALTALIALFTVAQVVLAAVAIFTSRAELRAYVLLDEPRWVTRTSGNPDEYVIEFQARIKNFGQTPAFEMSLTSNGKIDLAGSERLPDFVAMMRPEERTASAIMGPGGLALVPGVWQTIDGATYRALQKGEKRAFLWAVVDYKDAFGCRRRTTLHLRTEKFVSETFWPSSPCKEGNTAT